MGVTGSDWELTSSDSEDGPKNDTEIPTSKPKYPSVVGPYSRSTTLVIERASSRGTCEDLAPILYITPRDYLKLYREEGSYAHLAKLANQLDLKIEDDQGRVVEEEDVIMVIDDENRWELARNEMQDTPPPHQNVTLTRRIFKLE